MGIHVPDTPSFIDLLCPWLRRHDKLQGRSDGELHLSPLQRYVSCMTDAFWNLTDLNLINSVLMGKLYIVVLLRPDSASAFSGNYRSEKLRPLPNPFIKDDHSGEMQQSIKRVT